MSTSYDLFYAVYVGNLRYQVETHPEQYRWPANEAPAVAVRTVYGLATGIANKDSAAIKAACKALGIKHTYTALRAYLTDKDIGPAAWYRNAHRGLEIAGESIPAHLAAKALEVTP